MSKLPPNKSTAFKQMCFFKAKRKGEMTLCRNQVVFILKLIPYKDHVYTCVCVLIYNTEMKTA